MTVASDPLVGNLAGIRARAASIGQAHFSTFLSIATAFIGQAGLLVSGTVLARILGVENRGHFALIALGPLVFSQIGAMGLPLSATYYIARDTGSNAAVVRDASRLLVKSGIVMMVLHCLALLVLLPGQPASIRTAGIISLLATPGALSQTFGLAVLQGQQRFVVFNALRLLQLVIRH